MVLLRPQRQVGDDGAAATRPALDPEAPPQALDTLANADQAEVLVAVERQRPVEPGPAVGDLDPQLIAFAPGEHPLADTPGVPVGIVQRRLDESVERDLYRQLGLVGHV